MSCCDGMEEKEEDVTEEITVELSGKKKVRDEKEHKSLVNRLSRIEGQIRGLKNMIDKDAYCTDILMQVTAVTAALNSFSKVLLSEHIHSCVANNVRKGNDYVLDELDVILQRMIK